MTGMVRYVQCFCFAAAISCSAIGQFAWAQDLSVPGSVQRVEDIHRLALIADTVDEVKNKSSVQRPVKDPLPFASSALSADSIPPFAASPDLGLVQPASYEEPDSYKDTCRSRNDEAKTADSIDDCCRELTEMIAGNLQSDISLDAKTRMVESALRMVARNIELKAEARILKLEAEHALEMSRMQSQMMQMRSMSSATETINRVAEPLSRMLERNYQQSVAMNQNHRQLSQMLSRIGINQLEAEAREAHATRRRIQLTSPSQTVAQNEAQHKAKIEMLMAEMEKLQHRLDAEFQSHSQHKNNVQSAAYNQPLEPRRQPLKPLHRVNQYYKGPDQTKAIEPEKR